ncbi:MULTISPECIES: AAA family ATPase [Streptomyces]|uniref:LuxR C-terminal-related transcriptional regulator n=1 Tax=Streptomyces lonegramiae TaxID=3075524 RepID=A0ABU2XGA6_9ACTN|nr:AAA family ATPase [Streptomyces sp. DSM 41529]MDT0544956.1 LuxR C-terminal-related transcriptional regulator [Streptomyces sp. DSM 41529]
MQLSGLPLIGRERERAVLARAVAGLSAHHPAVVTLTGAAGFGQDALLRWAAGLAEDRGLRVLRAQGTPGETDLAYGAVNQLVGPAADTTPEGPAGPSPGLAELLRTARDRPTLLTVADVQWLDPHSLRWLQALVRRLPGAPVAVLAGASGPAHLVDPGAPGPLPVTRLVLRPLDSAEVAAAVALVCGGPGQERFTAAAADATAGHPAVLHDALRRFTDAGHQPVDAQVPRLRAITAAVTADHATRALRGLPAPAVAALRALAVCGDLLDFPLVCTLLDPRPEHEAGLRETLEATGLTAPGTGAALRLPGPEVRARVLEEMPAGERADLYARAAELAHRAAVDDAAIAALLLAARPVGAPWAVHALRRACADALRAADHGRAIACLTRALEEPLDREQRARLSLELASLEVVEAPEAGDRRFARILRSPGPELAGARMRAADLALARGGNDVVRRALADALPVARDGERDALTALFWLAEMGRHDDTDLLLHEVPALPGHPASPAQSGVRAWELALRGEDLLTTRALARGAFADRGDEGALLLPRLVACRALCLTDDLDEAAQRLDVLLAEVRRGPARAAAALVLTARGELSLRRGRSDLAERDVAAAERALPQGHWHPLYAPYARAVRILVALESGDRERAQSLAALPDPDASWNSMAGAHLLFARGLVAIADGRPVEAVDLLLAAGRRLLRLQYDNPALVPWRSMAARACHALGHHQEAQRLSHDELALARRWGAPSAVGWAELGVGRAVREERTARLREAVRLLRATPATMAYTGALIELVTAELDAGRRQIAAPLVAELTRLTAAHPGSRPATRARALAQRLGRPPSFTGHDRPAAWAALSEAERRTATLAGLGHGNRDIADTLSVTTRTVELRLSGAYRKLRISGRAELRALVRSMEGYDTDVA